MTSVLRIPDAGRAHLALFVTFGIARMMVVLVTLLIVLIWYTRTLNELKREAIAISSGRKVLDPH